MIGKIITYILVIVFSIFLYHILKVDSMWRKIANIVLFVFLICLCIFGYVSDKHSAYYGDAVFEHNVLPFDLQIIKGWNHNLGCNVYNFGRFGGTFTDEQFITIQTDSHTPNQYLCMRTILSYGYNKEEIVVHWLGCDSCDYYIRVDSPEWCFISPSQLISKNDIKKEDYLWVFLVKRKD